MNKFWHQWIAVQLFLTFKNSITSKHRSRAKPYSWSHIYLCPIQITKLLWNLWLIVITKGSLSTLTWMHFCNLNLYEVSQLRNYNFSSVLKKTWWPLKHSMSIQKPVVSFGWVSFLKNLTTNLEGNGNSITQGRLTRLHQQASASIRSIQFREEQAVGQGNKFEKSGTKTTSFSELPTSAEPCPCCNETHKIYAGSKFSKLDLKAKKSLVFSSKLCFNCLNSGHGKGLQVKADLQNASRQTQHSTSCRSNIKGRSHRITYCTSIAELFFNWCHTDCLGADWRWFLHHYHLPSHDR